MENQGEGSRGGKIIGRYKSGRAKYESSESSGGFHVNRRATALAAAGGAGSMVGLITGWKSTEHMLQYMRDNTNYKALGKSAGLGKVAAVVGGAGKLAIMSAAYSIYKKEPTEEGKIKQGAVATTAAIMGAGATVYGNKKIMKVFNVKNLDRFKKLIGV